MDADIRKLIEEKDKKIEELQNKIKELEKKLRYYEIKEIYQGLLPDGVIQKLLDLPPEMMVIEIGKFLRGRKIDIAEAEKERLQPMEREVEVKSSTLKARVGIDLTFTQKFDFTGSDVAFVGEDIMNSLGISEGEYVVVQKNGSVNLRALPYTKAGFIVIPGWVREKIGAKVNDFVEVTKK
ncbi:MAG: hypothetical protein QXN34_01490 [Archaeoglobaceae archaeon]